MITSGDGLLTPHSLAHGGACWHTRCGPRKPCEPWEAGGVVQVRAGPAKAHTYCTGLITALEVWLPRRDRSGPSRAGRAGSPRPLIHVPPRPTDLHNHGHAAVEHDLHHADACGKGRGPRMQQGVSACLETAPLAGTGRVAQGQVPVPSRGLPASPPVRYHSHLHRSCRRAAHHRHPAVRGSLQRAGGRRRGAAPDAPQPWP